MVTSEGWESRLLFTFLIGKNDRLGRPIEQDQIADTLFDLFESLKEALGGVTKMRPFEATGETSMWGKEPTTVVLVLAKHDHEETADSRIASHGAGLAQILAQDEVWITKQKLNLFVARHPE